MASENIPFSSRLTPDERATILRHISNVPVKLGPLARDLGLVVRVATLPHGKSGQISRDPDAPSGYMIRVNRHETIERQRFTLAHEIAHYLLHREKIKNGIVESVLYRADGISNAEEIEANRLAAEIVMPRIRIKEKIGNRGGIIDDEIVEEFAKAFQVSKPAMEIRLGLK